MMTTCRPRRAQFTRRSFVLRKSNFIAMDSIRSLGCVRSCSFADVTRLIVIIRLPNLTLSLSWVMVQSYSGFLSHSFCRNQELHAKIDV